MILGSKEHSVLDCMSRISYFYFVRKAEDSRNCGYMNEWILLLYQGVEIPF